MLRLLQAALGRLEATRAGTKNRAGATGADRRAEFERLAGEHTAAILGTARRLTRNADDAEDLAQDALVQAYSAFASFRPGTNFRAWVLRILTNRYITAYRRARRLPIACWTECETDGDEGNRSLWGNPDDCGGPDPAVELLRQVLDRDLEDALHALSDPVRLTVLLVDVEQLSYEEAADALGIPVGTVRSRDRKSVV